MTKKIIYLNTTTNCNYIKNGSKVLVYSFDTPPINISNGAKLKVNSIYEKGTSISITSTTTMNNTTTTTGATTAGIATTGTITGTTTGTTTKPNNIIYTFKLKDISVNSSFYYGNDGTYPTIANLSLGNTNSFFTGSQLTLNKQSINYINIQVSDDINNISSGVNDTINFIITLEIEEKENE